MSSPFSKKFNDKNPMAPLQGNAFIKAKIDAEKAGKKSFVVDGKSHPVQMEGSPYHKHGQKFRDQAQELSKDVEGQGGYDYENKKVTDLLAKAKAADARHVEERKAKKTATKVDSAKMSQSDPAPVDKEAMDKRDAQKKN